MPLDPSANLSRDLPVESAARLLHQRWPGSTLLTPADIGLGHDKESVASFLAIVESLSDAGFLSYEALVFNADGPMVIDAALTARGRAMLTTEGDLSH